VLRREEVSYGGERFRMGKILSRKGYLASYVLRREEVSYGGTGRNLLVKEEKE